MEKTPNMFPPRDKHKYILSLSLSLSLAHAHSPLSLSPTHACTHAHTQYLDFNGCNVPHSCYRLSPMLQFTFPEVFLWCFGRTMLFPIFRLVPPWSHTMKKTSIGHPVTEELPKMSLLKCHRKPSFSFQRRKKIKCYAEYNPKPKYIKHTHTHTHMRNKKFAWVWYDMPFYQVETHIVIWYFCNILADQSLVSSDRFLLDNSYCRTT